MANPDIIYSYLAIDDTQTQGGQRIERRQGRVFKVELSVDRSYVAQSSVKIWMLVNGVFTLLLHQVGAEVELARQLHALPPHKQGELERAGQLPGLYQTAFEKLLKLGCDIAR